MSLKKHRFPARFRRPETWPGSMSRNVAREDDGSPKPGREPDDEHAPPAAESGEAGWRASSYDLKHGLDVVELPTSLPPDVLDRLFNSRR
ncbi:MAG TPA: hypothetical protein VH041_07180 [Caldimonas sp.]|jgi:hypothetical protein|nr:hypothetical protein [Caldimonas sp.]HEX4234073.1 hypothetical protein [Caldimonas sp.]